MSHCSALIRCTTG